MMASEAPGSEDEVAQIVRAAASEGTPLRVTGGGTRTVPDGRSERSRLATSGLAGVTLYEPGALTMVVRAGTPLSEVTATLAEEGQILAFEPIDHRALLGGNGEPTIGGAVACNASGPRRVSAGACRDLVLGLRFVDGRGRILKNGGRVMKNVTGLDLAKLLCGSFGTMGVLTEVALKVMPAPHRAATLVFPDIAPDAAVAVFCRALGTPFEVSGAAWCEGAAYLRVEGLEVQVANRLARLPQIAGREAAEILEGEAHVALWRRIRDVSCFAGGSGAGGSVWRVAARPTRAAAIVAALREHVGAEVALDWGGGLIWAQTPPGADMAAEARAVRDAVGGAGHARLVRAGGPLAEAFAVFQPQAARVAALSRALRTEFDPAGIFGGAGMAD